MEELILKSNKLVAEQSLDFKRTLYEEIDWSNRLIGLMGPRGAGKTTILLQRIKEMGLSGSEALYVSLDDIYFTRNSLIDVAETFRINGGRYLFLDEVHKYPDWHREIKNIYDFKREITLFFTGSSIIDMLKLPVDLSRRAIIYHLSGLSFREFLQYAKGIRYEIIALGDLLKNHEKLVQTVIKDITPLKYFNEYLAYGYYPFFKENINTYPSRLEQVVKLVIEYDLAFVEHIDYQNIRKILELMAILAENVPFTPNISDLSKKLSMGRNTLIEYLHYLDKARLINNLYQSGKGYGKLEKPGKVLLENANLFEALAMVNPDKGSIRESFFAGQLINAGHHLSLPIKGDFEVDKQFIFEVGGRQKGYKQIAGIPNSFVAADELEAGVGNKIPLWLFGFLY
ncbi:hypothetical protein SAMN05216436_104202 [bacterium A37T11]|nr:hypothetical protein SAMN05216436_104202 [bacterium A37T11]